MRRILIWLGVAVVAAGVIVYGVWPRPLEVETAVCRRGGIEAAVAEEADTRLDDEYMVTTPVAGRLLPIDLREGDAVEQGKIIARVDTFDRLERLKTLRSRIRETEARVVGVDTAKPKPEDIRAADLAVQEARMRLDAARKVLDVARINYEQEKKQYDRLKRLHEEGTISDSQFDEAQRRFLTLQGQHDEADLNVGVAQKVLEQAEVKSKRLRESVDDNEYQRSVLKAQIQQIEADIAILEDELKKCEIRAPVSGPVLERYLDDEQVLPAGAPILTIGDLRSIRVGADILSEEIGRVAVGQEVEIAGAAVGEEPVTGKVQRIYPAGFKKISSLGIEQQRVKVIVAFDNASLNLRPGVRVDIRIITDRKPDVLRIPERALFKASDAWHVFAVRDGRARLTRVSVGLRNDEWAEITDGLQAAEVVITSPPAELADGDVVVPLSAAEAETEADRDRG